MDTTAPTRLAALAAVAALALAACTGPSGPQAAPAPTVATQAATAPPAPSMAPTGGAGGVAAALAALSTIPAKGRAPKTGYDRAKFGPAWKDTDKNGCDTRNDILRRDLSDLAAKDGTGGCVILAGTLADAYTGQAVKFARGGASEVDIDHLVPLSDAWQKGAQAWDAEKRERLANDPANLAATAASANRSKGDGDLATWLPPNRAHWCAYVAGIVHVKADYGLWMTQAEHDRAGEILADCPA